MAVLIAWRSANDLSDLGFFNLVGYCAAFSIWLLVQSVLLRRHLGSASPRQLPAAAAHLLIWIVLIAVSLSADEKIVFVAALFVAAAVLPGAVTWWAAAPHASQRPTR